MKNHDYIVIANEYSQLITYETEPLTKSKREAVVNDYEIDSVIYWWSGKFFVEWQRIPTSGATKWEAFTGPSGEQLLAVANSKSQAIIYIYDDRIGLFKPTRVQGLSPLPNSVHTPDVRSLKAFSLGGSTHLAVANFNESGGHNIFKLNFSYDESRKVGPSVEEHLSALLNEIKAKIAKVYKSYFVLSLFRSSFHESEISRYFRYT